MKILLFLTITSVFSKSSRLQNLWDKSIQKYKNLYKGYFGKNSTNHQKVMDEVDLIYDLNRVNDYGCWCHFLEHSKSPFRGHAMDKLDRICKKFHESKMCLQIDNAACDYDSVEYNGILENDYLKMPFDEKIDYKKICEIENELDFQNPSSFCKRVVCEVDMSFLREIYMYLSIRVDGESKNEEYFSKNGFDSKVCKVMKPTVAPVYQESQIKSQIESVYSKNGIDLTPDGSGWNSMEVELIQARALVIENEEPAVACCGAYPKRFPYKLKMGQRACCGEKTYDTELLECCDIANSKSRLIGSC